MTSPERPRLIVGMGASAGGIKAFQDFFKNMPSDTGMAFVVVLHLPSDRPSILPEILSRWTAMPVTEITEGCAVEANTVYVPPSGLGLYIRDRHLYLNHRVDDAPRDPAPISVFFDSLATDLQEQAIGVILSGTGHDGSLGLKAIKSCGGLTLAQGSDGTSPQYDGMPSSAIATGAVDIVASVEAMPRHIMAAQEALGPSAGLAEFSAEKTAAARLAICEALLRQTGHDFSGYKEKTFLRRVQRRMQVVAVQTLDAYVQYLKEDAGEMGLLFQDLLIGVTAFFRDAETFAALSEIAIPRLFDGKGLEDTVRVWVAGCATGEEAYSFALLLREHVDSLGGSAPKFQVFATDIDESAIAAARAGRYPASLVRGLSPERLSRFFVAGNDGSYTVGKDVRAVCTFSTHSLTRDPPFSRIDLISCRNLLIYLDSEMQAAIIPAFHYSLVPDGLLLLGTSETIARHDALFTPLDKAHRIFQRCDGPSPPLRVPGSPVARKQDLEIAKPAALAGTRTGWRFSSRASARMLERFAPAFVVVSEQGEIVQYSARIGRFLEPASGAPSQTLLDMVRRGLRIAVQSGLQRVIETARPSERSGIAVHVPGKGIQLITLSIEPVREPGGHNRYLVIFIEEGQQNKVARHDGADLLDHEDAAWARDHPLETELRDTREQLQSITEEHETALEELRSANEELHSVNEELQSTNEEWETSKEEIQSINEELQTVNAQLANKVEELDHKNSDLQNLFEGTQVAAIFLDPYLGIRGFTPAVASIYNLIPSDLGRPLTDIVGRLRYSGMREDVNQVLTTLMPLERRVRRDDDAAHYLMRILPYRTPESTVDGTIVTFVDVTSIVQAEEHQRLLVDELNHRVKNMLAVVVSLATQTLRRSDTMEEFSKNYLGRVHALAAAYSLLSNKSWRTVSLREVIMEELRPFLTKDDTNAALNGPAVQLAPRAALSLGMAIHELTTNAVKYGALSEPDGTIAVTWRVDEGGEGSCLTLEWLERNGPPVKPPERRGFGTMLIERGLKQDMQAEVTLDFAPEGVRATLVAPLGGSEEAEQGSVLAEP